MLKPKIRKQTVAEDAVLLYFEGQSLVEKNRQVRDFFDSATLRSIRPHWLIEVVPSFDSILLVYDMLEVDEYEVIRFSKSINVTPTRTQQNTTLKLPVCYTLDQENDRERIANNASLCVEKVIDLHCNQIYQVFTVGFTPGFAYMGECDERIETARLTSVRKKVCAGAVAIADKQTAVYPTDTPGGWNIIGHCPLVLIDFNRNEFTPFYAGMNVEFYKITATEFSQLQGRKWHQHVD